LNGPLKNVLLWVIIVISVILLINLFNSYRQSTIDTINFSEFYEHLNRKNIENAVLFGEEVQGKLQGGNKFRTFVPPDSNMDLAKELVQAGAKVTIEKSDRNSWFYVFLTSWFPFILFIGFWLFLMRQMQSGGSKALSFGKSRARLLTAQQKKATFKDVEGVDEAKEELTEIIEFLREPQKFQKLGGRIPKGVLLIGPPGTGKTLLARAIAGEANVPFFCISGSDFVEMFVGVGASRVRDLFEQGKKNAPCIIFIDEIDAVGRHRGAGLGGGHDEREQTLNQLLVEMDGFESNEGVILIAATNRPDVLDPALLRPGRFDRQVVVSLPDVRGREAILRVHMQKIPMSADVEISILARGTPGFSGAQLANLVNEAALNAARYDHKEVAMNDFEGAKDKVLMGKERRSLVINENEKRITAYHEAGHAMVAYHLPDAEPLHKVTIIPRGMALGLTQQLPQDDKHNYSKRYVQSQIAIMMGGRLAEEIFLDTITTGAANDIELATERARKMVCEWGMSNGMGPLAFGKREEQIFLGRELSRHQDYSEETAIGIDQEVRHLVMEGYDQAKSILENNRQAMIRLAETLLEQEVLDGPQIEAVIKGEPLPKSISSRSSSKIHPPQKEKMESPGEKESALVVKPLVSPEERPIPA